jgi:hypothetical protein
MGPGASIVQGIRRTSAPSKNSTANHWPAASNNSHPAKPSGGVAELDGRRWRATR